MAEKEVDDVLSLHSHLEDGALGPSMLEQPYVLVSALSSVSAGRSYRMKTEMEEREKAAKAKRT